MVGVKNSSYSKTFQLSQFFHLYERKIENLYRYENHDISVDQFLKNHLKKFGEVLNDFS